MADKHYEKVVQWHFEADGELLALTHMHTNWWFLEEVRKNGQEDEHFCATVIDGGTVVMIEDVNAGDWLDLEAIRNYLVTNGFPPTE